MAKRLKDEDLVLNIIINGNKSKKEMNELERAITDTNREINTLKKVQKDLIAQGKKETDAYRATVVAIEQKNKAILLAEGRLTDLRKGLKLTEMSTSDLRKEQQRLNKLLSTATPGSANAIAYQKQLDGVSGRLTELKAKAVSTGITLKGMADKFNHYIGVISAGVLTLVGLISGINRINQTFAEFDDKVADVRKTTGLTRDSVIELNKEFQKIDTRTSQEDLLGLARVAGKLGIEGKENILGFVKASDQIGVALAEDLGGDVEEALNSIGKLVDIFQLKEEFGIEKSILKVGSAINELGASSTANEGFLVEFTKRMAGVAPLAGITIQQVLGLGATLDQFGQTAEVSSTSLSKLFIKMAADSGKFAKYAGQSVDEFKKNLGSDFTGTFIKVLDGVKSTSGGINELAATLGQLDEDGSRTVGVLGVLAKNTDVLKQQIELANTAFREGTSVTNEFSIKNDTAAAKMDKARKSLYNLTVDLGEKLNPTVALSVNAFTYLVKILSAVIGFIIENKKVIMAVLTALVAYNAVLFINNTFTKQGIIYKQADLLLFKLQYYWLNVTTAANHLLSYAIARKNGNLALARTHMLAFNAATAANPLVIFLAVVIAVSAAISVYNRKLSETDRLKQNLLNVEEKALKAANDEKALVKDLITQLNDQNATLGEKEGVINRLREIMPDYLSGYTNEEILAGKAKKAIDSYVDSLARRTRAEAAQDRIKELQKKNIELSNRDGSTRDGFWGGVNETFQGIYGAVGLKSQVKRLKGYNKADNKAEMSGNESEIKQIQQNYGADMQANNLGFGTVGGMKAVVRQMGTELAKLKKGSKEYVELADQIATKNKTIVEMEKNAKNTDAPPVISGAAADPKKVAAAKAKNLKLEIDEENKAYQERLTNAGLFAVSNNKLTANQLELKAGLETEHLEKLNEINKKAGKLESDKFSQAQALIQKKQDMEAKYIADLINPQNELIAQENEAHKQRLEKAGLFDEERFKKEGVYHKRVETLTVEQNIGLETLEAIHQAKLNTADAKLIKERISEKQAAYDEEIADVRLNNSLELASIKTLADAKSALQNNLSAKEIAGIKNVAQAKEILAKIHLQKENDIAKKHAEDLIKELEATVKSGTFDGINLSDKFLSAEELTILKKRIAELKLELAKLTGKEDLTPLSGLSDDAKKVDIFGMSAEDWLSLATNLENGKVGIDTLFEAAKALINVWSQYNQIVANNERKQLQLFEAASNQKKNTLQNQLNDGQISQERYNSAVSQLDDELERKRAENDRNAAIRERNSALMGAIVNTAQSVTKLLATPWLAALAAAAGAMQIGIIASTPIPILPGKEEGGYVTRAQDGKQFKAKNQGKKRGYIDETSVLVSENGSEFVASAAAVANPEIKQVLDMIDSAQRNGNVSTLTLEKMMFTSSPSRKMTGKEDGGYVSSTSGGQSDYNKQIEMLMAMYQGNNEMLKKLTDLLSKPIDAKVALLGPNGFIKQMDAYNTILDNSNL